MHTEQPQALRDKQNKPIEKWYGSLPMKVLHFIDLK